MSTDGEASRGGSGDPLAPLEVIDRLEVGPARPESDRVTVPYRVVQAGGDSETELVYRYAEPVFDPERAADRNLASLIGAQVAINYGLFCREIVFHGPFDEHDRVFLEAMAANTAREIYVNKFLRPNEFLVGDAARLPTVRRPSYLRARLSFPDLEPRAPAPAGEPWAKGDGAAVLASGGKDSLLSLGLLEEAGVDTHSVFVNESGRHWYTALNGYRHLSATRPEHTVRVWTSADRLFAWMLRRLPFVRPDFARLRSDEYPIRLWTVAVFLFGALPVLRRRGLGRLVIGDEFDTSRRASFRGIPHFDGLYDQSRWFDRELTRFFRRKGWGVTQYSILRPLSELLIQKTLVERYPELQRHQVSCHAAHIDGERVLPCGRCEKCRRIVGMLVALEADPGACGYDAERVEPALAALAREGVHQEAAGERHLAWMLGRLGRIPADSEAARRAREHPEVMALRFDALASPPGVVPLELRRRLLPILLEHAGGAMRRSGRQWLAIEPLNDPWMNAPHGGRRREAGESGAARTEANEILLAEQTWKSAAVRLGETDTALLPVGAIEQHGPHLPLDTDAWDADYLCRKVAERCSRPRPLVLPLIPYGVSYHHDSFAGTISVGPEILARFVHAVGLSAARHGIRKLVIINGHGGNAPALGLAAQKINRDARIFTCVDSGETSDADIERLIETPNDVHAGETETSTALATRPHLVDRDRFESAVPRFSSSYLDFASDRGITWYEHTAKLSASGVLGDPTRASAEKGERIWELMIEHLVRFVEKLKTLSLEEIYERRH